VPPCFRPPLALGHAHVAAHLLHGVVDLRLGVRSGLQLLNRGAKLLAAGAAQLGSARLSVYLKSQTRLPDPIEREPSLTGSAVPLKRRPDLYSVPRRA